MQFVESGALVQDVLLGLSSLIKSSNAKVQAGLLPTVRADPTQLGRVFQNLIENAIKYAQAGRSPEIEIRANQGNGETIFAVADNGRGIEAQDLPRLFNLLERLHPDEEISGRGIGLATCKRIIERLGGRMWVESTLHQGSVFSFSIPNPGISQVLDGAKPLDQRLAE